MSAISAGLTGFFDHPLWALAVGLGAGLACGFLNTAASSGSAVSLPILMLVGLDPLSANATNRIPVLLGALSASVNFHAKGILSWPLITKVSLPTALGSAGGALIAERLPAAALGFVIAGALVMAMVLLFSGVKRAIEQASQDIVRFGFREMAIFFAIGVWLGFIVLDGATYLLLALSLGVGLNLVRANAIKSAVLVPTTVIAMAIFAYKGRIDWDLGLMMGLGSIAGGMLGARVATAPKAKQYIFVLLVIVVTAELLQLVIHYFLHGQWTA